MRRADQVRAVMAGGRTRRWHSDEIIGEERVDGHSWGMVSLLFVLHPEPTLDLVRAVQFHDAPEPFSGDIPLPAKRAVPELGFGDREVGRRWMNAVGFGESVLFLEPRDQWWLTFLDSAQALIFCGHQQALGNSLVRDVLCNILGFLQEHAAAADAPPAAQEVLNHVAEAAGAGRLTRSITEFEEMSKC